MIGLVDIDIVTEKFLRNLELKPSGKWWRKIVICIPWVYIYMVTMKNIKFGILEVVNPVDIDVKECKWMHNLNSFQPVGINIEYPFGLPLLGQN